MRQEYGTDVSVSAVNRFITEDSIRVHDFKTLNYDKSQYLVKVFAKVLKQEKDSDYVNVRKSFCKIYSEKLKPVTAANTKQ